MCLSPSQLISLEVSYCSEMKQCVTGTGAASWKIIFGEGVRLTIEASEYPDNLKSNYYCLLAFLFGCGCRPDKGQSIGKKNYITQSVAL